MKFAFPDLRRNKRTFCMDIKMVLIIVFFSLFTVLFYRQAVAYNGDYFSDLPAHINFGIVGGQYSVIYFIIGIIFRLPFSHIVLALFESSIVVLTFLFSEKYVREHFEIGGNKAAWISAGALFLCSLYIPVVYPYFYSSTLITQPWHNITYFGMRLFSIPVFFHTLEVLGRYRDCFTWKDWLILSIPLLLSASIKPNFLVDYSMALLCVLVFDFIRDCFRRELNRYSFVRYVFLGSSVFPAIIILFYQMYILYGGSAGSQNGMKIVFWTSQFLSQGMLNAAIEIIRDVAFPLLVAVYGYKSFSRKEKFTWLLFLITLIQSIILEETGPRAEHGNFTWGIHNAGYFLFLYMVPKFIQMMQSVPWKKKDFKEKSLTAAGCAMIGAHLFFGLQYFLILLRGGFFYI